MTILEAYNMPFTAALILMVILAIVQLVGVADMFGDADVGFDSDIDGDGTISSGPIDGLFSLIGLGRVPLTVWLALYLGLFAGIGAGMQELAISLTGGPLNVWLAGVLAGAATLPITGMVAHPLGRLLPQDETSAVSTDTLLGRRAVITDGVARAGSPARARVNDIYGHPHHVMVQPHEDASELHSGDEILLVRRDGEQFYATALADRQLSPN
ncbi:YqiJ family protein [Qipengyuania marisflavi]|uniref:DUF1449 family protein n=1 Tax=Qipengyuania marisflavi TaxID=2486356 RepID=A0A5S3P5X1_9SPHN|nr:YqiJ family protein [Qipengyuania marisflavi]TMM48326.1 DUF1449 family protein [Qipengyuania marisflavi]